MVNQSLDPRILAQALVDRLTKAPEFRSYETAGTLSPSSTPKGVGGQKIDSGNIRQ